MGEMNERKMENKSTVRYWRAKILLYHVICVVKEEDKWPTSSMGAWGLPVFQCNAYILCHKHACMMMLTRGDN
jgi:hypothetical protein